PVQHPEALERFDPVGLDAMGGRGVAGKPGAIDEADVEARAGEMDREWGAGAAGADDDDVEGPVEHETPYTASNTVARPWPTPTHIGAIPYLPPRRRSSRTRVVVRRAPEQPSGWPRAIAPPLTFSFSSSMPSSRAQARTWEAKASFSSIRSIWSR